MNLNFVLENATGLRILLHLGFIGSFCLMVGLAAIGADVISGVVNKVYNRGRDLSHIDKVLYKIYPESKKGLAVFVVGFLIVEGAIFTCAVYNRIFQEKLNAVVQVDDTYQVKIVESETLTLFKKEPVSVDEIEKTLVDGIEIQKKVSVSKEVPKEVLQVKCGALSFDECLEKLKKNLSVITAGMSESVQVVQF